MIDKTDLIHTLSIPLYTHFNRAIYVLIYFFLKGERQERSEIYASILVRYL